MRVVSYTQSDSKVGIWQSWRPGFGPGFSRRRSSACEYTGAMQSGPKTGMRAKPKPTFEPRWVYYLFGLSCCLYTYVSFASESPNSPPAPSHENPLFYSSSCPLEIDLTLALDEFRSLPEGTWNGNWGSYAALNVKGFLPQNFSMQLAGSYGLYDWPGRAFSPLNNASALQQQGFISVCASRQVSTSGINAGIAYDWMFNKHFGIFAVDPCFDQIRGQIGYRIQGGNEIGIWAAYGIQTSHKESQRIPLEFRGISQVNLFWCHYFKSHGYGMLWAGTPYRKGLMYESGRPGNWIVGVQFSAPLTKRLSIEGHGAYMHPEGGSGLDGSKNYASNISIGLTYAFGKTRIQQSPYMTPANNSNFLVDTNQNF